MPIEMIKVTPDTNVLISAVVFEGNEFKILSLARKGNLRLVISPYILTEFKDVLSRPKFGFIQQQIESAFKHIVTICDIAMPMIKIDRIKEDLADNKILECAVTGKVDFIVSGDRHLLKLENYKGIEIVRTRTLLNRIRVLR